MVSCTLAHPHGRIASPQESLQCMALLREQHERWQNSVEQLLAQKLGLKLKNKDRGQLILVD